MNKNSDNTCNGFIVSESLDDPLILNSFDIIYVKIEKHNDILYPKFWHLFKVKVQKGEIKKMIDLICLNLKEERWYAHFWSEEELYLCFAKKHFLVQRHQKDYSQRLNIVKEYAEKQGIPKQYLDFWIEG